MQNRDDLLHKDNFQGSNVSSSSPDVEDVLAVVNQLIDSKQDSDDEMFPAQLEDDDILFSDTQSENEDNFVPINEVSEDEEIGFPSIMNTDDNHCSNVIISKIADSENADSENSEHSVNCFHIDMPARIPGTPQEMCYSSDSSHDENNNDDPLPPKDTLSELREPSIAGKRLHGIQSMEVSGASLREDEDEGYILNQRYLDQVC